MGENLQLDGDCNLVQSPVNNCGHSLRNSLKDMIYHSSKFFNPLWAGPRCLVNKGALRVYCAR